MLAVFEVQAPRPIGSFRLPNPTRNSRLPSLPRNCRLIEAWRHSSTRSVHSSMESHSNTGPCNGALVTTGIDTGASPGQESQLERLPQELLQAVLQRMHSSHWPAARLVNKQFDASLAPLITTITIRQWPSSTNRSSNSSKMSVSSSSSLKQVRQLNAVIDGTSHLQQLLQLLAQLPRVQQLSLRGLKPLSGLSQLLLVPAGLDRPCGLDRVFPAAAAAGALAHVTQLDLPDSSSSSLPKDLQLPGLLSMRLFAVDSFEHLAGFAPQLQHLECCSLVLTSPAEQQPTAGDSSSSAVLSSCRTLAAPFVISSSAKTAVACLASVLPALAALVTLPQLQHSGPPDPQQQCDQITLKHLQAALPGLQLMG